MLKEFFIYIFSVVQLHLNPIHAAVQLRPSMRRLDEKESKNKTAVSKNVEDVVKSEEQQEAKPSGTTKKQVTFLSSIYIVYRDYTSLLHLFFFNLSLRSYIIISFFGFLINLSFLVNMPEILLYLYHAETHVRSFWCFYYFFSYTASTTLTFI